MNRNSFITGLCCILFCTCQAPKEMENSQAFLQDFDQSMHDTTLFSGCKVVALELNEEALIKEVDKIILFEDKIGILDCSTYSFFVFDSSGKFLHKMRYVGNGPGEYVQLHDVCLDKKRKRLAFLTSPDAVMFYDYNGKFLDKTNTNSLGLEMALSDDYIYIMKTDRINYDVQTYTFEVINRKDETNTELLKKGVRPVLSLYTRGRLLSTQKDGIYYMERFTNNLYKINRTNCELLCNLNLGKYNLPEDLLVDDCGREQFDQRLSGNRHTVFSLTNLIKVKDGFLMCSNTSNFFLYNHNEGTVNHYSDIFNREYGVSISYLTPVEANENQVAFVMNERRIASYKMRKNPINTTEKLKKLIDSLSEDANPVLFLYNVREK